MLYDQKQLPELRYMRQFHDDISPNFNYEQDILNKSLSPYDLVSCSTERKFIRLTETV